MTEEKETFKSTVELHLIAKKTEWNSCPILIRTIHRGKDGKVRTSKSTRIESYANSDKKKKELDKALKAFIDLFNLFNQERIE